MTFSRDGYGQFATSPIGPLAMEPNGGHAPRHKGSVSKSSLTSDELIEITKKALEGATEKHRALANHADLPPGWSATAPVDTLDLSNKGAKELPREVVELIKDRVERLALSHNNQINLPAELGLCSRLFYLNLRWNGFKTFPEAVFKLPNLQTLDLSRNRIVSIPDGIKSMGSLKFLAFTNNQVTRLPLCFGDMPSLTKLKFDDNPIEFPAPEEYIPTQEAASKSTFDPNTYVCAQVKRVLRSTAMRERQKQEAVTEVSESNLETPRPPKRTMTGRFPVRPSVNGIDTSDSNSNGEFRFPQQPPQMGQRSLGKDPLVIKPIRRPGLAPLNIDGMSNRSRSETVGNGNPKLKRLGYVPSRKVSGPPSANAIGDQMGTLKQNHFRNASFSPALQPPAGETSSETISPAEPYNRQPWMSRSRLSSLPEDRRISRITSPTIRSARLLVYSLDQLNRPIDDVIRIIKSGTPKKCAVERLHYNATQNLKELDKQLHILTPLAEDEKRESSAHVKAILKRSRNCVFAYQSVLTELRANTRKIAMRGEPMYLRALMLQIYASMIEVRNACRIQESANPRAPPPAARTSQASRPSQAHSDRTVTPTQPKLLSRRAKGARIIAGWRGEKSPGAASFAPPTISAISSRTNTMTSAAAPTPRSGESFRSVSNSRSNTMYSRTSVDSDEERQFERIYLNLRQVCDLADHILPNCRMDFFVRKEGAARSVQNSAARVWALALNKCDGLMNALEMLKRRLAKVRLNDPANRNSRDFWAVCDAFVKAWYDLASEMKNLGNQGLDIGAIKVMLRPVQKAVKDTGHILNHSPVYKGSLKPQTGHSNMPPTPLSAALGPAAQAAIPNTPSMVSPADGVYSYPYAKENMHYKERDRSDTVTSRYAGGWTARRV